MPAFFPTGPVHAKAVGWTSEQQDDENPAPQTNPIESLDEALQVRTQMTLRCACGFRAHHDRHDFCP